MIKLWFTDFWHEDTIAKIKKNPLFEFINDKFDIELTQDNPDYLIYSCDGINFLKYHCPRIFYTGENLYPDPTESDFSFSFDQTTGHNFYFPLPYLRKEIDTIGHSREPQHYFSAKEKFCNFVYSNPCCAERNVFYLLLSKYKKVDAAGKIFNNVSGLNDRKSVKFSPQKITFIRPYKFTIAFENASYPGYTTEKILHAFMAGSVPIYWGNPKIAREFNPNAFINCHDFKGFNAVIEHIIDIDNDDARYLSYLEAPPLIHENFKAQRLLALERFAKIFEVDIPSPVAVTAYNRLLRFLPRFIVKQVLKRKRQTIVRRGDLWRKCKIAHKSGYLWEYTKSIANNYTEKST